MGSVGAGDIARGVGSGLGVVFVWSVRVIAEYMLYCYIVCKGVTSHMLYIGGSLQAIDLARYLYPLPSLPYLTLPLPYLSPTSAGRGNDAPMN